jgi:hypothetical protein
MVFTFSANRKIGAFWVGAFAVLAGSYGISQYTQKSNWLYCYSFSLVILLLVALSGLIIESIAYGLYKDMQICTNETNEIWGNDAYLTDLTLLCIFSPSDTPSNCYCIGKHTFLAFVILFSVYLLQ